MNVHYKVLRRVEQADLYPNPKFAETLKMIPPDGYVAFDHFKQPGKPAPGAGLARARSLGIIRRASPYERVTDLDNVRFWLTQLNESGHKNTDPRSNTKRLYLGALAKFDGWLAGRSFRLHKTAHVGGEYVKQPVSKSFGNVEDLLECALSPACGAPAAQRVIREYLAGTPVISFDNVRRLSKETAGLLSGALEGLAMTAGKKKQPASFGNVRLILAAPEGRPKRLHSLAGKVVRYELPPAEEWKTTGEITSEFHSMRPRLYHEIFDILHRAFGDSTEIRPSTRMADFEILGRAISKHAGYGEKKFDEALWLAAGRDALT